jgi:hypothetical protein
MRARLLVSVALALSTAALSPPAPAASPAKKAPAAKPKKPKPQAHVAPAPSPPPPAPVPPIAPAPEPASAPPPRESPAPPRETKPAVAAESPAPPQDASVTPRRVTLTLNPLALVVGRYGANVELLIAPHHAIAASAYVQTFPRAMTKMLLPSAKGDGPPPTLGGELGYRFYTGRDGPSGLFVGPSLVAMPIVYPQVDDSLEPALVPVAALGGAIDVGAQAVLGSGFTIGGGVGAMALAYTPPPSVKPPPGADVPSYPEPHVLPRLLVMAGWSF